MNEYVFALAGLLLGWVVRDWLGKRKLDPNLLRAANEQIELVKAEARELRQELLADRESDRVAFLETLNLQTTRVDYWMNRCLLGGATRRKKKGEPPEPPPPPGLFESLQDIQSQVRLAKEGSNGHPDQIKQELLAKGLTLPEVEAILSGEYGDLPPGDRTDLFVQESIRMATGLQ